MRYHETGRLGEAELGTGSRGKKRQRRRERDRKSAGEGELMPLRPWAYGGPALRKCRWIPAQNRTTLDGGRAGGR